MINSVIFCHVAFWHIMPQEIIWQIIFTQYLMKPGYEFIMLPVTYILVKYLKKVDNIDYYDINTAFNPFFLKLVN